jgi:FMN phosphatase YigB (HAD superfamily)
MIVAFDIDGVLADSRHREHHIMGRDPRDWSSYYGQLPEDAVIIPIYNIAVDLGNSGRHQMYLCTGRPESLRVETTQWMKDNGLWRYFSGNLMMRLSDDHQPNERIKKAHALALIAAHGHIDLAFEDNPKSVEVWRNYARMVCHVKYPAAAESIEEN